jgi:hypothetical protein
MSVKKKTLVEVVKKVRYSATKTREFRPSQWMKRVFSLIKKDMLMNISSL